MYIRVYNLKDMEKADYERILKRSEVETDSIISDVARVIEDVKTRGDQALVDYTRQFEEVTINIDQIKVSPEEIKAAYEKVDEETIAAIRTLAGNVKRFHAAQMPNKMWSMEVSPGLIAGQIHIPLAKVGCYVPGGRGWFPSAVMMSVLPAKVAGVPEVIVCTPSAPDGFVPPGTLIACDICGADAVFRIGGSQAVAAMAHGTQTVPKVDKIVGPGSKWVLAAFKLLYGQVEIGTHAGPGEGLIIADESADPEYAAADICIQAEHGLDSAGVLVTHVKELAYAVQERIGRHIERLNDYRKNFVVESLKKYGAIIITDSLEESIAFANEYAVEHLEIMTKDPLHDMQKIKNAGGIYLGHYTPLSTGCFGSGPNHVLPTGRRAMVSGGLKTADFYKAVTFEYFSKEGLANLRDAMVKLADYEGFPAHGNAILERFARD
ncbi:MAG TPA: histidinol dehydrogenase [Bacillota bacterium]|jgi:histidinol dehydrogenase|nr:histidinol dehydrogenase [Peptococcaceae bacterium MAG4]NLW38621.1 histidinol dehydrogenase [Peptococcaceae bacterium]HPZ43931.1 histidinol dehydrogenase [Bacillota bacterium]HQD76419.1 histidinol dehydrogenase [Bacillota bacterium]HUM59133.1 histidinol dehydrogenase [Bacillota bacterium]